MSVLHTRPVRRSSISMPPVAGAYNPYRPSFEHVPSQKGIVLMIRFWERSIRLPFSTSMRATTLGLSGRGTSLITSLNPVYLTDSLCTRDPFFMLSNITDSNAK